jgi:hypothetical protein
LSVFALIVGFGTLILHAPGPTWIPTSLWIVLCIVAGVGLAAVWWKLADMGKDEPGRPLPTTTDEVLAGDESAE